MVNLLSVGRMVEHGWELRFKGDPSRCELLHGEESLGCIDMKGQLCFLDIEFVRPPVNESTGTSNFTAFTPSSLTWDLWHARLGHAGGDITKLLSAAKGVQVASSTSQTRCESCIVAKHPHRPYPTSVSPPTQAFLELVHTDICGPFPVSTLHGKRYFIVFLDDYTNVINVHLLATKDQALDAWLIVKARWENKFSTTVKAVQTDNGGEYMGAGFTGSLLEAGIEHRRSSRGGH